MDSTQGSNKSVLQLEGGGGTNYVYGNVTRCIQGAGSGNGHAFYGGTSITWHAYNNSTYAASGTCQLTWYFISPGTATFKNNIIQSGAATWYSNDMTSTCTFNDIAGGLQDCSGSNNITSTPLFTNTGTGDLTLQPTSPAKGTGTVVSNLGGQTFNSGPCTTATWPNPALCTRNASTWDMGAFVVTP